MPRQARQASETGIYHVMMRGINHQNSKQSGIRTARNFSSVTVIWKVLLQLFLVVVELVVDSALAAEVSVD